MKRCLLLLLLTLNGYAADDGELLRYFLGLYKSEPANSPARYKVDEICARWWHTGEVAALAGTPPVSPWEARERLGRLKEEIERGRSWQVPKLEVRIPRTGALELKGEYPVGGTVVSEPGTRWRLRYDGDALHLEAEFIGEVTRCDAVQPWLGDSFEIFLLPDRRLPCYREIVVNPDGVVFTALHTRSRNEPWLGGFPETGTAIEARAERTATGWRVNVQIPFRELPGYFRGNPPKPGETLYFNLLRTRPGRMTSAYPLLYEGHNLNGMITAILL